MSVTPVRHWILRVATLLAVALAAVCCVLPSAGSADTSSQLNAAKSAAGELQSQIAADTAQIAKTDGGLQSAQNRLDAVQADLDRRVDRLKTVQNNLIAARDHLVDVENHLHAATKALAENLVAGYESQPPSLVSVVLSAHGFNQLLNQFSFASKVAKQNAHVVFATRIARREVASEAKRLETLERRDRTLAKQVLVERNQAAALQLGAQAAADQGDLRARQGPRQYATVEARSRICRSSSTPRNCRGEGRQRGRGDR